MCIINRINGHQVIPSSFTTWAYIICNKAAIFNLAFQFSRKGFTQLRDPTRPVYVTGEVGSGCMCDRVFYPFVYKHPTLTSESVIKYKDTIFNTLRGIIEHGNFE